MDKATEDSAPRDSASDAGAAVAVWVPSAKERSDMIEVAAYHIAERSGFAMTPQDCWTAAEQQIDLMFALHESQKKLQTLIDTALDAVVMMDAEGKICAWNRQATAIFGWPAAEVMGRELRATIIPARHRDAHTLGLQRFLLSGEGPLMNKRVETQALHRDGHEFPVELAIAPVMTAGRQEFSAFIRDITERRRTEEELKEMATTDFLTGLANRRHFVARMTEELARLQRFEGSATSVLMLDLDHFKRINDSFGHSTGDAMLRHVAALLRDELRKIDTVGRVGGEEFAMILPGTKPEDARVFADRLRHKVESMPLALEGKAISITVSIGIAAMRAGDASADAALTRADQALYRAKDGGRNRVEVTAEPEMSGARP